MRGESGAAALNSVVQIDCSSEMYLTRATFIRPDRWLAERMWVSEHQDAARDRPLLVLHLVPPELRPYAREWRLRGAELAHGAVPVQRPAAGVSGHERLHVAVVLRRQPRRRRREHRLRVVHEHGVGWDFCGGVISGSVERI